MKAFDDVSVGEELPARERVIIRHDVLAYAEVSGDRNPLHLDDEIARTAGFPGVIAHGMFTMGHMAACVVAWCGDPSMVRELSAGFRAPVFMDETIVAGGRVVETDEAARTATLETWVTVERDGATEQAVRKGRAVIGFAG